MVLQYKSISSLLATIVTEDFDFSYANFKLGRKLLISQVYLHFLSRSLFELRKPFSILSITHIWWSKLSSNGCSRNLSNDFSFKFKEVVFSINSAISTKSVDGFCSPYFLLISHIKLEL